MYLLRAKKKADTEAEKEARRLKKLEKKRRREQRARRKYEELVDAWVDSSFNAEYLGSFEVEVLDGDLDKRMIKQQLDVVLDYLTMAIPASVTLSLDGIEVKDAFTNEMKMAHTLSRILYLAAHPSEPIVGIIAKNPKVEERFCHCFRLSKRKRALQVHKRVRRALHIHSLEAKEDAKQKEKRAQKKRAKKLENETDEEWEQRLNREENERKEKEKEKARKEKEKEKRTSKSTTKGTSAGADKKKKPNDDKRNTETAQQRQQRKAKEQKEKDRQSHEKGRKGRAVCESPKKANRSKYAY